MPALCEVGFGSPDHERGGAARECKLPVTVSGAHGPPETKNWNPDPGPLIELASGFFSFVTGFVVRELQKVTKAREPLVNSARYSRRKF